MKKTVLTLAFAVTAAAGLPAAEIAALWDQHCASCHAKDGSGNTKMGKKSGAKNYRDPKVQAEMKDEKAVKAVKEGISEQGKERMKPYKDKLSDDQIKTLVAHMRTFSKK